MSADNTSEAFGDAVDGGRPRRRALLPHCMVAIFERGVRIGDDWIDARNAADPAFCTSLSTETYERAVRRIRATISQRMQFKTLPELRLVDLKPRDEPSWCDGYETDFLNLISRIGLREQPSTIGSWTIKQLADVEGLGASGIIRLLRAIEAIPRQDEGESRQNVSVPSIPEAAQIDREDLRFGWLVKTLSANAPNLRVALTERAHDNWGHPSLAMALNGLADVANAATFTVAQEIQSVGTTLAKRQFQASLRTRNADLFSLRYGIAGDEASTLQAVGDHYRMTRERVRQVSERVVEALRGEKIWAPATDRLIVRMSELLPSVETRLNNDLREVLGEKLQVRGASRFAREVLGRNFPLSFEELSPHIRHEPIAVNSKDANAQWLAVAMKVSRSMIAYVGAAQLHWVAAETTRQTRKRVLVQELSRVLAARAGFSWVEEEGGWYWFGADENQNRILNYVRKIACVAQRQVDLDDFYAGVARVARDWRGEHTRGICVSPRALNGMLGQTTWLKQKQSNDYQLTDKAEPSSLLSETEFKIYEAMRKNGGLASRIRLRRRFVDRKRGAMNPVTFSVAIDGSPIFAQIDRGVFALRGWPIDSKVLRKAKDEVGMNRQSTKVVAHLSKNGVSTFHIVLTPSSLKNRQHNIPAVIARRLAEGAYAIAGSESSVRVANGILRGAATYAKRMRWAENSKVEVCLNSVERTASIALL